jgi:hypothetical protein
VAQPSAEVRFLAVFARSYGHLERLVRVDVTRSPRSDEWPVFAQSESARSSKAWRSTRAHKGAGCGLVADGCVGIVGAMIGEWFLPRFKFSSRSDRQRGVGGNLAVASSALGWRQRMGRGSVGGDYTSRKGSSAASPPDCDRKFERVTPTSRTPFGTGNTDRIRSRATSCSPCLVWIADSIDRLRVDN